MYMLPFDRGRISEVAAQLGGVPSSVVDYVIPTGRWIEGSTDRYLGNHLPFYQAIQLPRYHG